MTDRYELSRRKTLAGLATIGAAGAGAGLGTSALFRDTEQLQGQFQTGSLDMDVTVEVVASVDNDYWNNNTRDEQMADDEVEVAIAVGDVRPGDWAILGFDVVIEGAPGYVQARTGDLVSTENGLTDPESAVDDSGGDPGEGKGELQDHLRAEFYTDFDETADDSPPRSHLAPAGGIDIDADGNSIQEAYDALADGQLLQNGDDNVVEVGTTGETWYMLLLLPTDVGNVIQTDAVEFELLFEAEQARNNDDPFEDSSEDLAATASERSADTSATESAVQTGE